MNTGSHARVYPGMRTLLVVMMLACGRPPAEGDSCEPSEQGETVENQTEYLGCACTCRGQPAVCSDCALKFLKVKP